MARRTGGRGFHAREGVGAAWERGEGARWRGPATRNTAFEERRRETLKGLNEEANAFEEFERKQREVRDRGALDRFMAERDAPKPSDEPK